MLAWKSQVPNAAPLTCQAWNLSQGLSTLTRLTALTKIKFAKFDLNNQAMRHIGACIHLRDLDIQAYAEPEAPLTAADMMALTQLTGLTRLALGLRFERWDVVEEEVVSLGTDGMGDCLQVYPT